MEWTDEAIVLTARPHGERSAIVSLLTHAHGRHAGLVRGAARMGAVFQPGNRVQARWRGRLIEQLGTFSCELLRADAAFLLRDGARLACLAAACAMAETAVPERAPHPVVFATLESLIRGLVEGWPGWAPAYARWEMTLLAALGYGLDLTERETALRTNDRLAYVSPRTGRAVTASDAWRWGERLLPLPSFLIDDAYAPAGIAATDIAAALRLTGHFLERHALLPAARVRLAARFDTAEKEKPCHTRTP
ncbi:MAG: recO [Rhodospirillaceae bacterium]|nr:MAG: recO [Rhodospirillaceae bacterium]